MTMPPINAPPSTVNPPAPADEGNLRMYLFLLWRWAWLLALCTIVGAGSGFFFSVRQEPIYQATSTILISESSASKLNDLSVGMGTERLSRTYAQLLSMEPVLEAVIKRLQLSLTPSDIEVMLDVQPIRDTNLIEVRIEDTQPERAASIANTLVEVFASQIQSWQAPRFLASKESLSAQLAEQDERIKEINGNLAAIPANEPQRKVERDRLEATLTQYRQIYASLLSSYENVRLAEAQFVSSAVHVEKAEVPIRPVRPKVLSNTLLSALMALLMAFGVVFLIEALDDTVRDPNQVIRRLGLPILGLIARYETENGKPITQSHPRSPVAEAFRTLRTNIHYSSVDVPLKRILVTSPSPNDGKTTVAVNLGIVMAQLGRHGIILDCDLRRSSVHKQLQLPNRQGFSNLFLNPDLCLDGILQATAVPNLSALTAGDIPPNPAELLGSARMTEVLSKLLEQADVIVVDSPPVIAVTDAAILASKTDGVLLVLKPGSTKLAAAVQAVEQLRRSGARLLGVVLNDLDTRRSRYGYYHYYRGYYYDYAYYGDGAKSSRRHRQQKLLSNKS